MADLAARRGTDKEIGLVQQIIIEFRSLPAVGIKSPVSCSLLNAHLGFTGFELYIPINTNSIFLHVNKSRQKYLDILRFYFNDGREFEVIGIGRQKCISN
jgi:hypothetical protein